MTADRDEESGKFTEQYPREAFLNAVEEIDNATTTKVAEKVGCSYDLAYRRLNKLEADGEIHRLKIGASFIWTE